MTTANSSSENFTLDDLDSLLDGLTEEELDKINDYVDPEVILLSFLVSLLKLFFPLVLRTRIYQRVTVVNHKRKKVQQVPMIAINS